MKTTIKRILAAALVLALTLGLCAVPAAAEEPTTTIMLYMCGTDLQSYAVRNIISMANAYIPENVKLVVWAGGAKEWDFEEIVPNSITAFCVEYDRMYDIREVGSYNMGKEETLAAFMEYAAGRYPADRYGLILWDHGGGSTSGICQDEVYNYDALSMAEINNALYTHIYENGAPKFEFIGCDACLMATYEMASMLQYYTDYYVASQELEPGSGWGYQGWLSALGSDPAMSAGEICREIADTFFDYSAEVVPDNYVTLSVIYLPAIAQLTEALDRYSSFLLEALDSGEFANIVRIRDRLFEFGSMSDSTSDMVDLAQLVVATRDYAPNAASNVLNALEDAVVYRRNGKAFENACGLSVYMPGNTLQYYEYYINDYTAGRFGGIYGDFASELAYRMLSGDYAFTAHSPDRVAPDEITGTDVIPAEGGQFTPGTDYVAPEDAAVEAETPAGVWDFIPQGQLPPGLQIPTDESYAYYMELTADEIANLSYAEGLLLMDVGDNENYVNLGLLQNTWVDWENRRVYSLFDGCWTMLEDQLVPIYEQCSSPAVRRCLVPVWVNDVACYLQIVMDRETPEGRVVGYTTGYTEYGMPARDLTLLQEGDVVVPRYTDLYFESDDAAAQEIEFGGDPIIVGSEPLQFCSVSLENTDTTFFFAFFLNDIYGGCTASEYIAFEF